MKKLDVNIKTLIAIIALFGFSLGLMAQNPQRQQQSQHMRQPAFAGLSLTDEQKTEIKTIRLAGIKESQPLKDEANINRAKLNALVNNENPDMDEIVSLVEANGKIRTQIQIIGIENKLKVRALLTDEQKVIFDARSGQVRRNRTMAQNRQHRKFPEKNRF